jgi:hypothetical protein
MIDQPKSVSFSSDEAVVQAAANGGTSEAAIN